MASGGTVKVDDLAVQASMDFLNAINNQLAPGFTKLGTAGGTLSDPTHWAGGDATIFQSQIWPQLQKDMKNMQTDLTTLQSKIDKVLKNIQAAGGN